jgi:hypothetical protein
MEAEENMRSGSMSVVSRLEPKKSEGRRSEGDVGMPFFFYLVRVALVVLLRWIQGVYDGCYRIASGGGGGNVYGRDLLYRSRFLLFN